MELVKEDDHFILDGMNAFERNIKRIGDCILALGAFIVFPPLPLLYYTAMKREDSDPATFRQERIGRSGCPFNIYKFRSMGPDAEEHGSALYTGEENSHMTKVGRFLHDHHLGELPRLWNMFCDDMASIGPRPERQLSIGQIMKENSRHCYLLQIHPGIASYATLYSGYTDTLKKMLRRLRYDLFYLERRSWGFDTKILFITFMNIMFGKKF